MAAVKGGSCIHFLSICATNRVSTVVSGGVVSDRQRFARWHAHSAWRRPRFVYGITVICVLLNKPTVTAALPPVFRPHGPEGGLWPLRLPDVKPPCLLAPGLCRGLFLCGGSRPGALSPSRLWLVTVERSSRFCTIITCRPWAVGRNGSADRCGRHRGVFRRWRCFLSEPANGGSTDAGMSQERRRFTVDKAERNAAL